MTLLTILGICATFFTILILCVHGTYIGFKTYKRQQDAKRARKANLNQLISDVLAGDQQALKRLQQSLIADQINGKKGSVLNA